MGPKTRDLSSKLGAGGDSPAASAGFWARGWIAELGLEVQRACAEEVSVEWTVDERHLQPQGIVHGGVFATVVETCCSVGAMLGAPDGKVVVGVENHTSFVRAVRGGRLRATATPLHAGRRAQLWECRISDSGGKLVATGRLRLLCVDPNLTETSQP